ncbi:MAG: V-type ATPase subunit [Eubacteriales bacterium]
MTYKSYPFACASLKVKETKLLTKEKLMRIAETNSADEAYKALADTGYGLGETSSNFEALIRKELRDAYEYTAKIAPDEKAFSLYLLKTDYHNLKILLKLLLKKEPLSSKALRQNGTIPTEILKTAITGKKYNSLPVEMKEALLLLDRQFSVKEDVSLIGLYLDAAYATQLLRIVKDVKEDFIKEYITAYIDFTNVLSYIRLRILNSGKDMLFKVLIKGGKIGEKMFLDLFNTDWDSVAGYLARQGYEKPLKTAFEEFKKSGSLYAFEKARDDYLLNIIKEHKNDVFSIAPSISYILAKEREADNIRIIMTAKLNGKDKSFVFDRIKEMYS